MIVASGFNQHMPDIITAILDKYRNTNVDELSLNLAKSWYLQELDQADHAKSYNLAYKPISALSTYPHYFERDVKRQIIKEINIDDILTYRKSLLTNSVPYMLSLGNISAENSLNLYHSIKKMLSDKAEFTPFKNIEINAPLKAIITQHATSTDNALIMSYIPINYDRVTGGMLSYTLSKIISPWFFEQLRTKEQLGYAVFAVPVNIGQSLGLSFILQSNQYDPDYLLKRYQHFYPTMLNNLEALSNKDIDEYKKAILDELTMPPQTLNEELEYYVSDFLFSRFTFDSRSKKIEKIKKINKKDLIDFYKHSITEQTGLVLASQVLGKSSDNTKQPKAINNNDYTSFENASALQKLLLEELNK